MRRLLSGVALAALVLALPLAAGAGGPATDGAGAATVDTGSALVLLNGEPLATYEKTRPARGKKVDFSSSTVRAYRAELSALRNDFKRWLRANAPGARVNGEYDIALNAVSVELNGTQLGTLRSAPMVTAAEYQGLYRPAAHDDPDLELVHALEAWSAAGGEANAGAGVKVAIVDTGIDASAVDSHGTHVAGTIACNVDTPAVIDGVDIPYDVSGVAAAVDRIEQRLREAAAAPRIVRGDEIDAVARLQIDQVIERLHGVGGRAAAAAEELRRDHRHGPVHAGDA